MGMKAFQIGRSLRFVSLTGFGLSDRLSHPQNLLFLKIRAQSLFGRLIDRSLITFYIRLVVPSEDFGGWNLPLPCPNPLQSVLFFFSFFFRYEFSLICDGDRRRIMLITAATKLASELFFGYKVWSRKQAQKIRNEMSPKLNFNTSGPMIDHRDRDLCAIRSLTHLSYIWTRRNEYSHREGKARKNLGF